MEQGVKRSEAEALLGLEGEWTPAQLRDNWKREALRHHPDRGGSDSAMAAINTAYETLRRVDSDSGLRPDDSVSSGIVVDRPSFVVDVLPVEAFEVIELAARVLGDVIDDDPPYSIEVLVEDPVMTWCRLEIVPDAGSSTVSIVADGRMSAEEMCDIWVRAINELAQ